MIGRRDQIFVKNVLTPKQNRLVFNIMKTFCLTLKWTNEQSVSVTKQFHTKREAMAWQKLCEEICGKNEHGHFYYASILIEKK